MNRRAGFDTGPLSWVKGEIDASIARALEALRAFAAGGGDPAGIKVARANLHQAHGALTIVGLDGVTRVSEELEALLADCEREESLRTPEVLALAARAFEALVSYLDALVSGGDNQPLRLMPVYGELVGARGRESADPVDLYFPDLSFRPPWREKAPVTLRIEEEDGYLREQRARFQRGLLKWLRQDAAGAAEMRVSVEAIEAAQGPPAQRAYWWVALAFFEALERNALPAGIDAKRMSNRVEQQIRRLLEGSHSVAERLLRETLYYVARARPETEHLRLVQETCALARTLPAEELAASAPAVPKAAREALAQAKEAWNKFASDDAEALAAFQSAVLALQEHCAGLGNADLAALTREVNLLAAWIAENPGKMSEAIALEVATALLLLDSALDNPAGLGTDFVQQAQFVCGRLKECVLGTLLRTAPPIPLLDEMSRKAQERLVMSQVVAEMQANLRHIEQVLDGFFRDRSKRAELLTLERPAQQVKGALEMLRESRARDALEECDEQIRRFARPELALRQEDFERVAQTLSGLGFYIEGLAHGSADFDEAMRPIAAVGGERQQEAVGRAPTVEVQLQQQQREAERLYDQWKKKPTDTWLKNELQKNVAAIQKDAGLVADAVLEGRAQDVLRALEDEQAMPLAPSVAGALEKIATAAAAPEISEQTAKLIDASAEAIDAEMLAVYLEEAEEVLETIRENLRAARANPADREALTVIRRGFHTLKGSGRMVGLLRLGEAAWAVEKTINLWLEQGRAASDDLLRLIGFAQEYFFAAVARLKAGAAAADEAQLIDAAARVAGGGDWVLPAGEAIPAVPVERPAATEAPEIAEVQIAADIAAAQPSVQPEASAPAQPDTVAIGTQRVSRGVFLAFCTEAKTRLATIQAEREIMVQHGIITDDLIRAAHTLAGICGTVGAEAPRDLGYALERALQKLGVTTVSEPEEALVGRTIEALELMVDAVIAQQQPASRIEMIELLDKVGPTPEESPPSAPAPEPMRSFAAAGEPASAAGAGEAAERRQWRLDDEIDPALLPVFLEEASELVPAVGAQFRQWRENPEDAAGGHALQRSLHTLKGSARMAGAMALGELVHNMETRVEEALPLPSLPALLAQDLEVSLDRLAALYEQLQRRAEGVQETVPAADSAPGEFRPQPVAGTPGAKPVPAMLRVRADAVDRLVNEAGEVSIARSRIEGEMRSLRAAMRDLTDNVVRLRSQLRELEIQAETQMQSRLKDMQSASQDFDPLEFDRFTRVQELTRLMTESVADVQTVHQNLVNAVDGTDAALAAQARLSRELQQGLMRVRMVPFSSLVERLHRIVRQTAGDSGRRANLEIRGAQVELDRSVLERMTGAFEHLIRNAVTHGIEPPAERAVHGKSEIGEIRIEVAQEGNEVVLALSDDGRGLDIQKIRERAVANGLMGSGVVLADAEIAEFIFLPGFTTAAEVTQVAGRGVGMDVVRTEVAALGGRIELKFARDQGTKINIYLPLTLAVTQALLVKAGARTYAIPAVIVEQVLQFNPDQLAGANAAGYTEWQGRRYPLHYLPRLLGESQASPEQRRHNPVLLLRSGINAVALQVDELAGGNREIVVKPIGPQLQRVRGVSGATVLGSGEIVLIINPAQLVLRERSLATSGSAVAAPAAPQVAAWPTVMVVDDSLTVRKITGRLLAREGYEVLSAKDGVDALDKLREFVPDVMLVDIEMPRMDGFDLTRNIRADPRLREIPIIVITSRTADKHRGYASDIGANAFLGKPFQEDELLSRIDGLIKARAGR